LRLRRRHRHGKRQHSKSQLLVHGALSSCARAHRPFQAIQLHLSRSWVFGYLSGANAENAGVDFLRGREPDELMDYCQRNPGHGITQAINELIKELQSGR